MALVIACALVSAVILTQSARAATFTTLHSFDSTDGATPYGGLVRATNGRLYGVTFEGGNGDGTIYMIDTGGTLTSLYSFCPQTSCADGANPNGWLIQDTQGDLYGATYDEGANGCGTVFKITPTGTLTTLHSFDSRDGCASSSGLVQVGGALYGVTGAGGGGGGTVFKMTAAGKLTTLHSFAYDSADGSAPSGLIQATDRNLYGATYQGGKGYGTIFEITPAGKLTTLYKFCSQANCTDGSNPASGPIQASDGNFYGTTTTGGVNGYGTVFKLTAAGKLITLHAFDGTDGSTPSARLLQATDGNLYGTTVDGGTGAPLYPGTIFRITTSGTLTTLYNFCSQSSCTDGSYPYGAMIQDTDGAFYGTTIAGGANGHGTIFKLSVGLGPFVETQPTSGTIGAAVKILGNNLTGTTSVFFNDAAASFTIVSTSEIETTVPTGASTDYVDVVTPSGTLQSNEVFTVTP